MLGNGAWSPADDRRAVAAPAPPQRIVSLNLCTDQALLLLAPDRIAALSVLASDPLLSVMATEASRHPAIRSDAEDVLRYDPDLVIAAPFAARATVDLLRSLGRRVIVTEAGQDIAGFKQTLRLIGREISLLEKAEGIITAFENDLASSLLSGQPNDRPTALVLNFGGLPSGAGSLADTALSLAGYRNGAADYAASRSGAIPLEAIVARPPDLLVLGQEPDHYHTVRADNLRHPALATLLRDLPHTSVPQRLTMCALPQVTQAVRLLAAQRDAAGRHSRRRQP